MKRKIELHCDECGNHWFEDHEFGGDFSGTLNSLVSPQIVQLLIAPNDATWQGRLIGLGSDGATYEAGTSGKWEPIIPPLTEG